jgi:hypothetical protein
MSLRWFVYHCGLFGAWAALLGWVLGRLLVGEHADLAQAGFKGLYLGLTVALALGLVDALWSLPPGRLGEVALRAAAAVLVGCAGGAAGGLLGQALYGRSEWSLFLVLGWTVTGLLVGLSIGTFEAAVLLGGTQGAGAFRKLRNGALGGTAGGLLGGALYLALQGLRPVLFADKPKDVLWSPSALGFVVLGLCIGLLIGLAQVVFREAWLKVEAGFRAGHERLLSKDETVIGRSEACDIGLFGDAGVDPRHAHILRQAGRYVLVDLGSKGGTYLNGVRITQPALLRSGDLIGMGRSALRFGERGRRSPAEAPVAAAAVPGSAPPSVGHAAARWWLRLDTGNALALGPGTRLTAADLPGLDPQAGSATAEVTANPSRPEELGLTNRSRQVWTATLAGAEHRVEPGRTIKLQAGTRLRLGRLGGELMAAADRIHAPP